MTCNHVDAFSPVCDHYRGPRGWGGADAERDVLVEGGVDLERVGVRDIKAAEHWDGRA